MLVLLKILMNIFLRNTFDSNLLPNFWFLTFMICLFFFDNKNLLLILLYLVRINKLLTFSFDVLSTILGFNDLKSRRKLGLLSFIQSSRKNTLGFIHLVDSYVYLLTIILNYNSRDIASSCRLTFTPYHFINRNKIDENILIYDRLGMYELEH